MSSDGRYEHLRASALELLACGNSTAAVAQVLAVPRGVVARWHAEPASAAAPVDVLAVQRARTGAVHFRTTLVLNSPLRFRAWHYVVAMLCCTDAIVDLSAAPRHPGPALASLLVGLVAAVALGRHLGLARTLLILQPDAALVPGLLWHRRLPYSEMADYWLVSVARGFGDDEIEGRLLTLHSRRAGVAPLEVFIDDRFPVDPALIERLDEVKAANRGVGPLTPMRSIPKD